MANEPRAPGKGKPGKGKRYSAMVKDCPVTVRVVGNGRILSGNGKRVFGNGTSVTLNG